MKQGALNAFTILYLLISTLFNYGLYRLLIKNQSTDQYFLILIYFLAEIISFIFSLVFKTKYKIIDSNIGPLIIKDNSINTSMVSENDNNISCNNSEIRMGSIQQEPFVGMKWISFIFPSFFDFFSKFFIFNGLKIIGNEIIIRSCIHLFVVIIFSKIFLSSNYLKFNIIGILIVFVGLIASSLYFQFNRSIKLYFDTHTNGIFGLILCSIGEVLSAIQILFQIKYFRIGEKHCYREIAWEGLFGVIISSIFFGLSLLIPCDIREKSFINKAFLFCSNDALLTHFESHFTYLLENIKKNIIWTILFFISSIFYNLLGAILAKYIGEVFRAGIDAGRIGIIIYLVLFLHNSEKVQNFQILICGVFLVIISLGMILAITLRTKKGNIYDHSPLDKSFSQNMSIISDEDNTYFEDKTKMDESDF